MVDYAIDTRTGREVRASRELPRGDFYICPVCKHLVWLRAGRIRRPHFGHDADPQVACEEYAGGGVAPPTVDVGRAPDEEDSLRTHGVYLNIYDRSWELYLRLRELGAEHCRGLGYRELTQMSLEVKSGAPPMAIARLTAWELRPGLGVARVVVPPRSAYWLEPRGLWTGGGLGGEVRGLDPAGQFFRPRGDAWIRLSRRSSVIEGESLAFVGASSPPPDTRPCPHPQRRGVYQLWRVTIPSPSSESVNQWLAKLELGVGVPRGRFHIRNIPGRLESRGSLVLPRAGARKTLVIEREPPPTSVTAMVNSNEYVLGPAELLALEVPGDRALLAAHQSGEEPLALRLLQPSPDAAARALRGVRRLELRLGDEALGPFERAGVAQPHSGTDISVGITLAEGAPFEVVSGAGATLLRRAFRAADAYELNRVGEYLRERLLEPAVSRIVVDAYGLGRVELQVRAPALSESLRAPRLERWLAAHDLRQGRGRRRFVDGRSLRHAGGWSRIAAARALARSASLRAARRDTRKIKR